MSAEVIARITQAVNDTVGVMQSAIVEIEELSAALRGVAGDEAATLALADALDAKKAELAAAVAANDTPPA